jgi:hypothetical protein
MKHLINSVARRFGYEITRADRVYTIHNGWQQIRFVRPDGSFDYDKYRELQTLQNKRDLDHEWDKEENIAFLAGYLLKRGIVPHRGLCHGTKRGEEQLSFRRHLPGCDVFGTEISDNATSFPYTLFWDFHEIRPEWIDQMDFIYSNALDHAYDPQKAIEAWMSCIRPGGYCFVEWHTHGESVNDTDPFSADIVQLVYAITQWGKGRYCVRELIPTPIKPQWVQFVVIHRSTEDSSLREL